MPLKICHVTDFLPGLHKIAGGAEYAVRRILEEQAGIGLDVHVITTRTDFPAGETKWKPGGELRTLDRLSPRLFFVLKQFFVPKDPLARFDLSAALRRIQPDLVHFHNLHYSSLSLIRRAKRMGFPTVWSIYDYWLLCPSFMLLTKEDELCARGQSARCADCIGTERLPYLRLVKAALFSLRRPMTDGVASDVDRFVVLSRASKALLARHGVDEERIRVIPQYIWKEAAERPLPERTVRGRLAYVGWVERRKGLHVVVKALARLRDRRPEAHLHVLGLPADPDYRRYIGSLVEEGKIADKVEFKGRLSREELLEALGEAYLVVIPEQWENMAPVILTESMAGAKCVLASRTGGIPEFVEEYKTGLLAERDDPEDFASRIEWAMEHPEQVRAMGAAARARARETFDPGSINESFLQLYDSLVSGRDRQGA